MTPRKKLPIGIQDFRKIRQEGYYYVDKTPFVAALAQGGAYYFLSRPRRFGKSLFLDTLAEAFAGNRELFQGLYLEHHWDWNKKHPVIRFSFAEGRLETRAALDRRILQMLRANQENLGVDCDEPEDIVECFRQLIVRASEKFGQRAVVLVDEYDKPILDHIASSEIARIMRDGLYNLYSVIKGQDAHLEFVFLTGVSKFSKVSIFSGLNNLSDITLDGRYSSICGYTETDLGTVFAPEVDGLNREAIRHWYNGYAWDGEGVYNPFDVLLLFDKRQFRPWWFETGTPTFLIDWLTEHRFHTPTLEGLYADDLLLSSFDVERILPEAMLWQTGYMTIASKTTDTGWPEYCLKVPNHEVRTALNRHLLQAWHPDGKRWLAQGRDMRVWLSAGNSVALRVHFESLFASIPHDWYRKSSIANYEGYYASVFYSHLAALGLDIVGEDVTNEGRCDLVVRHEGWVYLFEFKVIDGDHPTGEALAQLLRKDYAAKYRQPDISIIQIGVEFSRVKRQIVGWEVA